MKKRLKVLMVFDSPFSPPKDYTFEEEFKTPDWQAENAVYQALLKNGHEVAIVGLNDSIDHLLEMVKNNRPDIIFNLTEVFRQKSNLDKNVVALFELMGIPYTGACAGSLFICNDKALSKKIFSYHRVKVPGFCDFYRGSKVSVSKGIRLPAVIKPLNDEASRGISRASLVTGYDDFMQRIKFIHDNMQMDAIAEEYIEGREFYVSIMGSRRLKVLPIREMKFGEFGEDARIATYKAKWDDDYRRKWGIENVFADAMPSGWQEKIEGVCKKAYRILNMRSYARLDVRVTDDARVYILEANANPNLDPEDELAQSALKAGISYQELIQDILQSGLERTAQ